MSPEHVYGILDDWSEPSRMSNQVARRSNQMATDQRSNENDMPVKLMMLHHLNLLLKLSFLVFFDVRVP